MAGPGRGAGLKRVITPEDGWSAIVNALAEAQAGDLVRLTAGRFEGAETLSIPAGVSLVGAGNGGDGDDPDGPTTLLRFVADAPAIELREAHGARLSSLRVVMAPEAVAWRALPEATPVNMSLPVDERPLMEWGAVFADRAEGLDLSELSISAANPYSGLKGIVFRICDGSALTDSHVWGFGGSGISAISSLDQRIKQVSSRGNLHGIAVIRSEAALDRASRVRIVGARSHGNATAGIVLFSSEAEAIENCEAWGNGASGIMLQRDPNAPQEASRARIVGCRSHGNTNAGIVLSSSESEAIEDCEARGNGASGIMLQRDPKAPQEASRARIVGCRSHGNTDAGIVLFSSEAEAIEDSEAKGNGTSGIMLQRDSKATQEASRARIMGCRSHGNTQAGILLFSSEAEVIESCDCWGNGTSGIMLQRDSKAIQEASRARIVGCRSHGNIHTGIVLASSESEAIEDCEAWGNGTSGIMLQRDPKAVQEPSRARIVGCRSHGNTQAGIVLSSSESEAIEDCEAWGNGTSGIVLQRASQATQEASRARIVGCRSHGNRQAGILLFSSEAEAIEDCACWNNGSNGISLRDPKAADRPPLVRIADTLCFDNIKAGFDLLAGNILGLSGNRAFENGSASLVPDPLQIPTDGSLRVPASRIDARQISTDPIPGVRDRVRDRSVGGALARELEAQGVTKADEMARLVAGCGCVECLAAAWSGATVGAPISQRRRRGEGADIGAAGAVFPGSLPLDIETPAAGKQAFDAADPVVPREPRAYRLALSAGGRRLDPTPLPFDESVSDGVDALEARIFHHVRACLDAGTKRVVTIGVVGLNASALKTLLGRLRGVDEARGREDAMQIGLPPAHRRMISRLAQTGRSFCRVLQADCDARTVFALREGTAPLPLFEAELAASERRPRMVVFFEPAHLVRQAGLALLFGAALTFLFWAKNPELVPVSLDWLPGSLRDGIAAASAVLVRGEVLTLSVIAIAWLAFAVRTFDRRLPKRLRIGVPSWLRRLVTLYGAGGLFGADAVSSAEVIDDLGPWRRWLKRRLFGGLTRPVAGIVVLNGADAWSNDDKARLKALTELPDDDQCLIVIHRLTSLSTLASGMLSPFAQGDGDARCIVGCDAIELILAGEAGPTEAGEADITGSSSVGPLLGLGDDADALTDLSADLRDGRWTEQDLIPTLVIGSAPSGSFVLEYDRQNEEPPLGEVAAPYAAFMSDTGRPLSGLFREQTRLDAAWNRAAAAVSVLSLEIGGRRPRRLLIGRAGYRAQMIAALRPALASAGQPHEGSDPEWRAYVRLLTACGELYHLRQTAAALAPLGEVAPLSRAVRHLRAAVELRGSRDGWQPEGHRREMLWAAWRETAEAVARLDSDDPLAVELDGLVLHAFASAEGEGVDLGVRDPLAGEGPFARAVAVFLDRLSGLDPSYAALLAETKIRSEWAFLPDWVVERVRAAVKERTSFNPRLGELLAAQPDFESFADIVERHSGDMPRVAATAYLLAARLLGEGVDQALAFARMLHRHARAGVAIDVETRLDPPRAKDSWILDHLLDERTAALFTTQRLDIARDRPRGLYLGTFDPINRSTERLVEIEV
ncbi:right-handed parallel beta-helix repeat-containing protein [Amorphus orientalis]|uniref:Nitrous oxidase accessory protein NosD n=1 Tax=Amorphus orientalis TaxID=649198 RepID=A0AAE3VN00_9HYPH|nr:right-handed parallel beta-helix repeat-containing protein [Amorphus orientalis]MDQ0314945.1 nitrous oxidase accessory protein NosD [Amorphus orientalis]